jgi:hypothetical protein
LFPRDSFSAKRDVLDFQVDDAHFINTVLQLGAPANETLLTALAVFPRENR